MQKESPSGGDTTENIINTDDAGQMLKRHIEQFNVYDLERLQTCFEYEYNIHPEKEESISEILTMIKEELTRRKTDS